MTGSSNRYPGGKLHGDGEVLWTGNAMQALGALNYRSNGFSRSMAEDTFDSGQVVVCDSALNRKDLQIGTHAFRQAGMTVEDPGALSARADAYSG